MNMKFIFLYVTFGSKKEAVKVSESLLQKKLIACANIFPIESAYWWERKIKKSKEVVAILKTTSSRVSRVKREILFHHSYQVPCITQISAEPNKEYASWLLRQF